MIALTNTTLIAIGGGLDLQKPSRVIKEFLLHCGGSQACIVIIPTASRHKDTGERYQALFQSLGVERLPCLLEIRQRAEACNQDYVPAIEAATGIFLTGGNQVRLTAILGGTPVEAALHRAYQQGAVIAGTSAGAAALSAIMLAFGKDGATPKQSMAQFSPGLGFTDRMIIDQHFRQRDRLGRLLFAVANHPGILGIGIDEETAAILEGDILTVIGQNAVTIIDGAHLRGTDIADIKHTYPIALSDARVHVLTQGCTFNLKNRRASIPEKGGNIE
jgi:cyanophycinase